MKKFFWGVCLALSSTVATVQADVISGWTFEVNTPADLIDSAAGPTINAEQGTGS